MAPFEPRDPDFTARVRASFGRQAAMTTFGAQLVEVAPGAVEIVLPFRAELAQQHGYLHGGVTTAIVDSACGYAALSLLPAGVEVLTVEYKVNFLAPAAGQVFVARGRVTKPGRTLTVCAGDVIARDANGRERPVATMLATTMAIPPRDEVAAPRPGG
ncbi:MAG TPA: PaaI family thioesterase [Thermomicrobiales bacterium]|nr:PaaI family thioesterase [Thermomicrobiales bacterium]